MGKVAHDGLAHPTAPRRNDNGRCMPTPFMHLHLAEQIGQQASQNGHGRLAQQLADQWPAFYLGSVAPDINAISPIARTETHFYQSPPLPEADAYLALLARYPQLRQIEQMPPQQALFVAAYCSHLLLDLIWLREVDYPIFFQQLADVNLPERRLVHFALLAYLDGLALAALPSTAVDVLSQAQSATNLPFMPEPALRDWRDLLTAQLQPGGTVQTAAIFGKRAGLSADEFNSYLTDPAWMESHVFSRLPMDRIHRCLQTAVPQSIQFISTYLQNKIDLTQL